MNSYLRKIFLIFAFFFIPHLANAQPSISQWCDQTAPQTLGKIEQILFTFSKNSKDSIFLSNVDPVIWADWSYEKIMQSQNFLDTVRTDFSLRALKIKSAQICDEWVLFHGLALKRQSDKMILSLQKIEKLIQEVKALGCISR